jgi:hypothetical protein
MRDSLFCGLVAWVAWFLFAGPVPGAGAAESSLAVKEWRSAALLPGGDDAHTWQLKLQGDSEVMVRLVALSGEQAKTCATATRSWKTAAKDKPSEGGEILLLYKRQPDEQIVPALGFIAQGGEGKGEAPANVVKLKGKLVAFNPRGDFALSPKQEHLLEIAVVAGKDSGVVNFGKESLKTLEDVKTWATKNPMVTVIVLTVSWFPAE